MSARRRRAAEGHFSPLLLAEQPDGGPGVFRVTDGKPVFQTDNGVTHSYDWDMYHDYAKSDDGLEVRLTPGIGARVFLITEETDRWIGILQGAGVLAKA